MFIGLSFGFYLVFIGFPWLSLIFIRLSLIFMDIPTPLIAELLLVGTKTLELLEREKIVKRVTLVIRVRMWCFVWGFLEKQSVPAPSAAIGPPPPPSVAFGGLWVVGGKRGYGSPPSNSPRLLF